MTSLKWLRQYSVPVILTHDLSAVVLAWWIAFFVRFDLSATSFTDIQNALKVQCLVVLTHSFFYWHFKTYRPLWRFFSLHELLRLAKAVISAWIANIMLLFMFHDLIKIPKSIWFIYPLWLILILGLSRLIIRSISDRQSATSEARRVLVIGAGKSAELYLRELARFPEKQFQPVACLDDDATLVGKEIRAVPILGNISLLAKTIRKKNIDLAVITLSIISKEKLRLIVEVCEECQIAVRILPTLTEVTEGYASQPREVAFEDLLGRDPVSLDWQEIKNFLSNQIVLVSGGGGSIGSELCQQILQLNPKQLIIVDHSEFNLYEVEKALNAKQVCIELVNITDTLAIKHILQKHKPDIVFHAAAYKHVPILEFQPFQAVKNNIMGTKILAEAAVENNVKKFVMISSDKAVNPTNIMGATKRIAEIFCQTYNRHSNTAFITVRFGNVIGSTGSVIPLFKKQIGIGGPVTVTHPDMTRYFMTIKEASQLVLQAGALGTGGEIFVLDMGEPIKIVDVAKHLIQLSGKKLSDIEIVYTGLRPGEKMFEELFYGSEALSKTTQKKIFKANIESQKKWHEMLASLKALEVSCSTREENRLLYSMCEILEREGEFLEKNLKIEDAVNV
ncbi:MAG: nucleoside-diphosphate sugar epimerase/dehydratase [Gammaproteobacteria bacterium]|nr:nucleoside-diphosphate sugar epimerase/dehydratase [Gammaproteobacteria bacterium]